MLRTTGSLLCQPINTIHHLSSHHTILCTPQKQKQKQTCCTYYWNLVPLYMAFKKLWNGPKPHTSTNTTLCHRTRCIRVTFLIYTMPFNPMPTNRMSSWYILWHKRVIALDFVAQLVSLLSKPCLNAIDNLVFNSKDPFGKYVAPDGHSGNMMSGEWYSNACNHMESCGIKDFHIQSTLYIAN